MEAYKTGTVGLIGLWADSVCAAIVNGLYGRCTELLQMVKKGVKNVCSGVAGTLAIPYLNSVKFDFG